MKRPTQADVARLAGVSGATVSYVINDRADGRISISQETRERVLRAVKELGYEPDARGRSLRSGDTRTIGLIIPDVRNPHFWENAEGVEQEARAADYHLLLSSMDLNSKYGEGIFKNLSSYRIDGLILMGSLIDKSEEAEKTLEEVLRRKLAVVEICDHSGRDCGIDSVVSDYRAGTREVMSHLFSLGHRRIGVVYGVAFREEGMDRLGPYCEGLEAAGLPVDWDLVAECGPTLEQGYQAALSLLGRPDRPTAVLVINDLLAIGVLRAAADLGLDVPGDVSLVGFDDIAIAEYLVPRLTTVSKDAVELGRLAFRLLLERIQDPDQPQQRIIVPTHFIPRESTRSTPSLPLASPEV
ncbi:MAG: LacI family DNA-binding transcriptional regulator [Anaerolineae bacterium]